MTQDEIIRMAREAGLIQYVQIEKTCVSNALERFAALVAANLFTYDQVKAHIQAAVITEREACVKVADNELMNTNMLTSYPPKSSAAWNIAAAIRARGEKNV